MHDPEDQRTDDGEPFDWRGAVASHPIGRYGGLAWLADVMGRPRRTVYAYSAGQRRAPSSFLREVERVLGNDHGSDDDGGRHSG